MESGIKFESFSELEPGSESVNGEREPSPETEKTEEELMLAAFESGSRFDDEDEKARDYNARLDKADKIQDEINGINEAIRVSSQLLMGLSLTPEQQRLLYEVEQLTVLRNASKDATEKVTIDAEIQQKTKEFAALPVTPEQGGLLDEILQSIAERTKAEENLQHILH